MSQVAVLEEVSFQIASDANKANVGGLVGYLVKSFFSPTLNITDSFCRASFNSAASPVKRFFNFIFLFLLTFQNSKNKPYGGLISINDINTYITNAFYLNNGSSFLNSATDFDAILGSNSGTVTLTNVFYPSGTYNNVAGTNVAAVNNAADLLIQMTSANGTSFDFVNVWEGVVLIYQADIETKYCQNLNPPLGPKGNKGEKGVAGEKGNKGDMGEKGEKGNKGDMGEKGLKGSEGNKGDKGNEGNKGNKGDSGNKGVFGNKGVQGDKGVYGNKGNQGSKGNQGNAPSAVIISVISAKREELQKNSQEGKKSSQSYQGQSFSSSFIYIINVSSSSVFTTGEIVYVTNAGFFRIASINSDILTLVLISRGESDTGVIISGDSIVPAGATGPRGKSGKAISKILAFQGDPLSSEVDVVVDNPSSVVVGALVYVEGVGYYLVSSYNGYKRGDFEVREGSRAFHLTFVHRSSTDTRFLSAGLHLITSGPRGPRGRPGKDGKDGKDASASIQRSEQSFALFHSSLSHSLKRKDALPFDFPERIYLNLPNGEISSPLRNREFSSSSVVVSESCPPGKRVLIGTCKWELLSKKQIRNTWCKAKDFIANKRE